MNVDLKDYAYGKGVVALGSITKDTPILELGGEVIHRDDLPEIKSIEDDRYLQIDEDIYLGPSGGLDDFVNHSCSPNAGIRKIDTKLWLVSIKNIEAGDEITFDYSTTIWKDDWEMDCLCKNSNCRGKIGEFKNLPESVKIHYKSLGIVLNHILKG